MHGGATLIQDLAIVMMVSALVMVLCKQLRLPLVLGYILTGLIIGPHTPPFPLIKNLESINTLSELGIIFLLFSIGLEFSFKKIFRVGIVSFIGSSFVILIMIWCGFTLGRSFGWSTMDSVFLGAILSISSTTIIAKLFIEADILHEKFAQISLGILIVEDLIAIIIIALLSGAVITGHLTWTEGFIAAIKVCSFIIGLVFTSFLIVPKLLKRVAKTGNAEMLLITVLGLCFGSSLIAAKFGLSIALGAFLMGAVIAETPQSHSVIKHLEPIRDMFTAVFFVSVGMLIDPSILWSYRVPILLITLVTISAKVVGRFCAVFLTGYEPAVSLKTALGLAQIGEFSFIIASLGLTANVTSSFLYPIAVAVSGLTTLSTPLLMHNSDHIIRLTKKIIPAPLATLTNFYTTWAEQFRRESARSDKQSFILSMLRRDGLRLFFYGVAGCSIILLTTKFRPYFDTLHPVFFWFFVALLTLPVLVGTAYTLDHALWHSVFLNILPARTSDSSQQTEKVAHKTFHFLVILLTGGSFIALGSVFYQNFPWLAAVAGLLFLSAALLWETARSLHAQMEKTLLSVFDQERLLPAHEQQAMQEKLVKLISDHYPWEVETQDFMVPYKECALNQTIQDLKLRTETGVSIVAIYRDTGSIPNPLPSTRLLPGDVILIIGNRDQLKNAMAYLSLKAQQPLR